MTKTQEDNFPRNHYQLDDGTQKVAALPFFRPTIATFTHSDSEKPFVWKSRHQRKARHHTQSPGSGKPRVGSGSSRPSFLHKLRRMLVVEYWNISWWVSMAFTIGSIVWVINGFYAFLPFGRPSVEKNMDAVGWTAWVGATIFVVGGWLYIFEAWNRGETAYFGWGLQRAIHGQYSVHHEKHTMEIGEVEEQPRDSERHTTNSDGPGDVSASPKAPLVEEERPKPKHWIWFSTNPKYFREIGFVAAVIQLCAATIFWISGWTGLPVIQNAISQNTGLLAGIFWTPQVIGGSGFIISSTLMMLETQKKWYKPEPTDLGWQVGFWNFLGGVGFTICGAFGYSQAHRWQYQSTLSTFWGGWAFLIGSIIQWYEAVNPVTD